eukprot:TRINITY_DN2518_c0_g1_i1.p1 TRINITY_DN2518_c0_g1~~TRINITY_DN2518_c0_g1_i1.p1  ORF type:complete len:165 (-),score=33.29 TRINITY_DN2518_c0_g1_i1:223-717(-)
MSRSRLSFVSLLTLCFALVSSLVAGVHAADSSLVLHDSSFALAPSPTEAEPEPAHPPPPLTAHSNKHETRHCYVTDPCRPCTKSQLKEEYCESTGLVRTVSCVRSDENGNGGEIELTYESCATAVSRASEVALFEAAVACVLCVALFVMVGRRNALREGAARSL